MGNFTAVFDRFKNDFRMVYYDHPNRELHILITVLLLMLVLDFFRSIDMRIRINSMDSRNTVLLLSIQEKLNKIRQEIEDMNIHNMENHKCLSRKLGFMHSRLKTLYFDLTPRNPKRAPRNEEEAQLEIERRQYVREKMMETEFRDVE